MKFSLGVEHKGYSVELLQAIIMVSILIFIYFIIPSKMMPAEILIMAIPTMAFILLLGYTGLLSFSIGGLFAVGAYTAGILLSRHQTHILIAILAGVFMGGIIALIMGYFCIKRGGLIFALLTLAFNELIYFTIWQWKSFLGGSEGIWGINRSTLDLGIFVINLKPSFNFYLLVVFLFILLFFFVKRLIDSPFGRILMALRESEIRAKAIGINPEGHKWIAFIISGMICGLGGTLFALHQEYVGVQLASWFTSGEFVIMALLGGAFVIHGALIGSGIFIFLTDFLNRFTILSKPGTWLLVLGIIFILIVMFLKGGIYEAVIRLWGIIKGKSLNYITSFHRPEVK